MCSARDHYGSGDLLLLVSVSHSQHTSVGIVDQRCSTFRFSRRDHSDCGGESSECPRNVVLDVDLHRRSHRHDRPSFPLPFRFLFDLSSRDAQGELFLHRGFSKRLVDAEFLVRSASDLRSPPPSDVHGRVSRRIRLDRSIFSERVQIFSPSFRSNGDGQSSTRAEISTQNREKRRSSGFTSIANAFDSIHRVKREKNEFFFLIHHRLSFRLARVTRFHKKRVWAN